MLKYSLSGINTYSLVVKREVAVLHRQGHRTRKRFRKSPPSYGELAGHFEAELKQSAGEIILTWFGANDSQKDYVAERFHKGHPDVLIASVIDGKIVIRLDTESIDMYAPAKSITTSFVRDAERFAENFEAANKPGNKGFHNQPQRQRVGTFSR